MFTKSVRFCYKQNRCAEATVYPPPLNDAIFQLENVTVALVKLLLVLKCVLFKIKTVHNFLVEDF